MTRQDNHAQPSAAGRSRGRQSRTARRADRRLRLAIFGGFALIVGSLAVGLVAILLAV